MLKLAASWSWAQSSPLLGHRLIPEPLSPLGLPPLCDHPLTLRAAVGGRETCILAKVTRAITMGDTGQSGVTLLYSDASVSLFVKWV